MIKIPKYYEGVKLITKSGPVIITKLDNHKFTFKFLITGNEQTFPRGKLKDHIYPNCTDEDGFVYKDWLDRFDYFKEEIADQIDSLIEEYRVKEEEKNINRLRRSKCPPHRLRERKLKLARRKAKLNND